MKIIICGVGRVGLSIASYLSMHDNDITVIESSPELAKRVSDTFDITAVIGHASQPDILKKADAEDADIVIAVTDCDEVNMVACQVAHSVFDVPKKIARIRNKEYRDPAWSNLFSRNHMPIDVIISPEEEIAESIIQRMSVPGTTNDISFADNMIHISGLIIHADNPMVGERIKDIYITHKTHNFNIFMVLRHGKTIDYDENIVIQESDEIHFICPKIELLKLLECLGNNNDIYSGAIIISGGGVIGESIATKIAERDLFTKNNLVIIESDLERARHLNRRLNNGLLIHGSALDNEILTEAGTQDASIFVSVMNNDENNILSAVLAKKMGAKYSIALSSNKLYSQLLPDSFIDSIVSPEAITVSKILHNLRQGYIQSVFAIRDTGVELIEAKVTENCGIVNIPFSELHLHKRINILAVYKPENNEILFPHPKMVIKSGDHVILLSDNLKSSEVEKIFSFSVSLF